MTYNTNSRYNRLLGIDCFKVSRFAINQFSRTILYLSDIILHKIFYIINNDTKRMFVKTDTAAYYDDVKRRCVKPFILKGRARFQYMLASARLTAKSTSYFIHQRTFWF